MSTDLTKETNQFISNKYPYKRDNDLVLTELVYGLRFSGRRMVHDFFKQYPFIERNMFAQITKPRAIAVVTWFRIIEKVSSVFILLRDQID